MIVTLTGAYRNVGDHLIRERAHALLREHVDSEIVDLDRLALQPDDYNTMNRARMIFLCGGPAYQRNIYPAVYPLDLERIEPPIVPLGLGWKGAVNEAPANFRFSKRSEEFVRSIHERIPASSCRDMLTVEVLERHGVHNVVMTGCPAWYDKESMLRDFRFPEPKHVVVSDPANITPESFELLKQCRKWFPGAAVSLALHHGYYPRINSKGIAFAVRHAALAAFARSLGYRVVNLPRDLPAMKSLYDRCDLHLGYRVHAHIYCLSRRTPSMLISEDSRGVGQSSALGGTTVRTGEPELTARLEAELSRMRDQRRDYFEPVLIRTQQGLDSMRVFLESLSARQ